MEFTNKELWSCHDSTKIMEFMGCPRKYFYRYILGWVPSAPNNHLIFGQCWHLAKEHLANNGYSPEAVQGAYKIFAEEYRKHFSEADDEVFRPKSLSNVHRLLVEYSIKYAGDTLQTLFTEVGGICHIAEDRLLYYRIDEIGKDNRGIIAIENKTASTISQPWIDSWSLSIQIGSYYHVLCSMYKFEEVYGVVVDGVSIRNCDTPQARKKISAGEMVNNLVRVPIRKSEDMLNDWLTTVNHWIDMIEWNSDLLKEASPDDDVLLAFPKNTTSCTRYGACPYLTLCQTWPNPLNRCQEVPHSGFKVEFWDPRKRQEEAKTKMEIEYQGGYKISD